MGENCFLDLPWYKSRPRASQYLLAGLSSSYTVLHELHRASTVVKSAFSIFPDTSTCHHVLHSNFTEVKTALSGLSAHTQACTSFTGLTQW